MVVNKKFNSQAGFTLIEIMTVVIILGMLVTVAVISVSGAQGRAQAGACRTDFAAVEASLAAYRNDSDVLTGPFDLSNRSSPLISLGYLSTISTTTQYTIVLGTVSSGNIFTTLTGSGSVPSANVRPGVTIGSVTYSSSDGCSNIK